MRVATIDIGTNTVLLLVADRRSDGSLVSVTERATITRLGEGVDRTHRFLPAAVERTMDCLREYAEVVRGLSVDRIGLVGTSAMRDAEGGGAFSADAESLFGVAPQVISGDAEARLTFRGAVGSLGIPGDSDVVVFDIGGGSTEIVLGKISQVHPIVEYSASFDIGSVRLTERHVMHNPPNVEEREAMSRAVRDAFASVPGVRGEQLVVGVAGTMTTLAAVSLGLVPYDGARVHGFSMRLGELERVVKHLAEIPLEVRRLLPGMEPKRADVIVAGGMIALGLLRHWSVDSFTVSDRGLRWGLAEELH